MKTISELLRDSDPLQFEPTWPSGDRDLRRQAILAAATRSHVRPGVRSRSLVTVVISIALMIIVVALVGSRAWSPFVSDLQGAVRFEVRLAEDKPAPGLREAKVSGSNGSVYLHEEVVVDNGDIAEARVVPGRSPSQYAIDIKFNAAGAEKMRAATGNHVGKLLAILLDGQVVMAPVLRSPISASALVTGNFTKAQAERIANGIEIQ
jgi:hypothetical protein